MSHKLLNFLQNIGFDEKDIDDFHKETYDYIDKNGRKQKHPDLLFAKTLIEENSVDIRDTGENIENYWQDGWMTNFTGFSRQNFSVFKLNYYKAFPTRYQLSHFKLTKSLRRVLNKNKDLKTTIRPLRITFAKEKLYEHHHFLRYNEPPEKTLTKSYEYIVHHPSKLLELCIFKKNKLVACSIFEKGNYAMYGNTSFWDLQEKHRSLGILTVILEIQYALKNNFIHYYLGNFLPQNPNYHYKTRFKGLELYDWETERWILFSKSNAIKKLFKQKLDRY